MDDVEKEFNENFRKRKKDRPLSEDEKLWREQNVPNVTDDDFKKMLEVSGGNGKGQSKEKKEKDISIKKYSGNGRIDLHESIILGLRSKFVSLTILIILRYLKTKYRTQVRHSFQAILCTLKTPCPISLILKSNLDIIWSLAGKENLDFAFHIG